MLQDHLRLLLVPLLPHHCSHQAQRPPKRTLASDRSDLKPTTLPLSRHHLLHLHQTRASIRTQDSPRLTSRRSRTILLKQSLFNYNLPEIVLIWSRSWLPFWLNVLPLCNSKFEAPAIPSQPLSLPCANIPITALPTLVLSSLPGWLHMLSVHAGVLQNHALLLRSLKPFIPEGLTISLLPVLASLSPSPAPSCPHIALWTLLQYRLRMILALTMLILADESLAHRPRLTCRTTGSRKATTKS